jgi:hypothetical protein
MQRICLAAAAMVGNAGRRAELGTAAADQRYQ